MKIPERKTLLLGICLGLTAIGMEDGALNVRPTYSRINAQYPAPTFQEYNHSKTLIQQFSAAREAVTSISRTDLIADINQSPNLAQAKKTISLYEDNQGRISAQAENEGVGNTRLFTDLMLITGGATTSMVLFLDVLKTKARK